MFWLKDNTAHDKKNTAPTVKRGGSTMALVRVESYKQSILARTSMKAEAEKELHMTKTQSIHIKQQKD